MEAGSHWTCLHGSGYFMKVGAYGHLFHGNVPSMEARCHWACLHRSDSLMEMGAYDTFFMEMSHLWRQGAIGHASMEVTPLWIWVLMGTFFMEVSHPWRQGAIGHASMEVTPLWRWWHNAFW
ncbi:hypothetical protein MRB53_030067 [Persea americana]|uniref:Uncharacterized protein n=1 Tax=Persea americana TaxID=3435 RepID=A0ACC2KKS5_PERAE|nr:hypothetical protein MRB53_030067 [Persea americana]